ncbi:MAG: ATPase, T2SS/T4P/T4SS family, partial [Phycisphaerae bacterium]
MTVEAAPALGSDLLEAGWINPQQLNAAEEKARADGKPLEETLLQMRVLLESQLAMLRANRLGIPYCDVSGFIPNLQNAQLVPEDVVRRHVMFPLFVADAQITLVMADPLDATGIDQVRLRTRMEVEPCTGAASDIMGLIERAYGAHRYMQRDQSAGAAPDAAGDQSQPVIKLVDNLLREAIQQRASDIHVEPGDDQLRVRIRVDGVLREVAAPPLELHRPIVSRLKVLSKMDIAQTRRPQDGSFSHKSSECEVIVRVSVLPTIYGEAVVLRLLRHESEVVSLSHLGLPDDVLEQFGAMIERPHGIILVSGPTGSGKSTTLYSAMHRIANPQKNLIAIEDPVEYRTPVVRQVQVNPEVDLSFATGLRSILRQDPDVVMVGEIRDKETAQIAVQAALTGHLVLSTVHTNDAIGAVTRLRDLGLPSYLMSSALIGVLAQRLCRRICDECKVEAKLNPATLKPLGLTEAELDCQPVRGQGCRRCVGTGYSGRV